jgi:hypothetical protein
MNHGTTACEGYNVEVPSEGFAVAPASARLPSLQDLAATTFPPRDD